MSNPFQKFIPPKPDLDKPDLCKCSTCEKTFKISDCHQDYGHHNGWEMPAYNEITCPECEDGGCVDDYFFSDKLLEM